VCNGARRRLWWWWWTSGDDGDCGDDDDDGCTFAPHLTYTCRWQLLVTHCTLRTSWLACLFLVLMTMWPWTGMWLHARVRRVLDVSHGRTMHSALLRCQWPIQLGIMHDIFRIDQLFCVAFDWVAHKMRVRKFEIVAPSVRNACARSSVPCMLCSAAHAPHRLPPFLSQSR
jgi:hypothetical protein